MPMTMSVREHEDNNLLMHFLRGLGVLVCLVFLSVPAHAQTGSTTGNKMAARNFTEPAWLDQGVVFVGNWEPLVFRVRAGGQGSGGLPVDVTEEYEKEHTEETLLKLKSAGVNLIITHFYKTGLKSDGEDIEVAKRFVALCHKHGIKVGLYVGGTIFAETLLRDVPEAKQWVSYDEYGVPNQYGTAPYRYLPDFNNPGYVEYMKRVLRVAVLEVHADLIHFDNMAQPTPPETGNTPEINRRFREFLHKKYTSEQLKQRFGFSDISALKVPSWHGIPDPASMSPITDPVVEEWIDFRCQDFSDYYQAMAEYIRQLNPNVVVELNPHGIFGVNRAFLSGVDHVRLLPHGSVFWSEEQ
ncbi:MAG: beta-galactosidase, partial [Edaphobacter sp.]